MSVYLVVELTYLDESWRAEYGRAVPPMVAAAGGRYLAAGKPDVLEAVNPVPDRVVIFDFPSAKALKSFLSSRDYQPYAQSRKAGAKTQMYLIDAL
ncbi:DUF1330 domain-containing protein [Sphingobium sp.]|uniref:DUF1330 domain-containing protein n=1 Tax=Sphingobium sp. TaxID=1912891 RepID=UPI002B57AB3A|nr:DUF1330 domain-containing protein [Sphingobium sp.]HUD94479.1 DUF1330 domain-containing protein [Sphingobium sp.]